MATSVYICSTTFGKLWQFTLQASSLLPSTYFWLILLPSELSHSWVTSSAHPHQPSSILPVHQRGGPTLQFLSFLKEAVECDGKMRQWRFLMETNVPLGDNKGATGGKLYLRHDLAHFNVSSFLDLYARI